MEIKLKRKEPLNMCDYGAPGHVDEVYQIDEEKEERPTPYKSNIA